MSVTKSALVSRRNMLLGGSALGLSACVDAGGGAVTTTSSDGPLTNPNQTTRIGLLVPDGSGDANFTNLANNFVRAAEMALAARPEAKIEMRTYATGAQPSTAAGAAQRALSEGAKLLVGPLLGQNAVEVGRVAASRNVNVLTFSNNPDVAGGNVITLGNSVNIGANRLIGLASARGFKSLSVITTNNAAGESAIQAARQAASRAGVNFNGAYRYALSPDGVRSAMPGIAAEISRSGTNAVLLSADFSTFLTQIADYLAGVGLNGERAKLLGLTRWDIPASTLSNTGLQGGWFPIPDGRAIAGFNTAFTRTYGGAPHPLAGIAYDGVIAVATLLTEANRGALQRSQLSRASGFRGSAGAFRILSNNTTQRVLSVAEVNAGTFRIISNA
ncbi:MAG: penicillin-binding protein activator, partial [Pseudomonadota bacterium]